jgi:glycylpeptide N-tetradecanoyltransferase
VYELLTNHYVEDFDSRFRFKYAKNFLTWALKAPGWSNDYHVGVRIATSKKLMACIFGIPVDLRVRQKTFKVGDINYLCVHKKLRDKRLAPVLIGEVTRKFNLNGIFQGLYTAGIVLPSPISTCRYFHRTLDFEKLYAVGFSPLPKGMDAKRWARRFILPPDTQVAGLRKMQENDLKQVGELLKKYLDRFDMAQEFSKAELKHWFLHADGSKSPSEQVIWSYVVEQEGKITDFFSFYLLDSTVIRENAGNHKTIRCAYSYYYATDSAFQDNEEKFKKRLNELFKDQLVIAKQVSLLLRLTLLTLSEQFRSLQRSLASG